MKRRGPRGGISISEAMVIATSNKRGQATTRNSMQTDGKYVRGMVGWLGYRGVHAAGAAGNRLNAEHTLGALGLLVEERARG